MDSGTLFDPRIVEASRAFVAVRVDADDREDLVRQWQVRDLPCLILRSPSGGVLGRRENDYLNSADSILAAMQSALEAHESLRRDEAAAREAPDDPERAKALALRYYAVQRWDEAAQAFERYRTLDPENRLRYHAKAEEYLVYLELTRERWDAAVLRAEAFENRWPNGKTLPQVLYWKGFCLHRAGRTEAAIAVWEKIVADHPKSAQARLAREGIEKARGR